MSIKETFSSLPAYIKAVYGDLYSDEKKCKKADSMFRCALKTFFYYDTLADDLASEIHANKKILQMGISFGNQIQKILAFVGMHGSLEVIDINPNEVKRFQEKVGYKQKNLKVYVQDAKNINCGEKYDFVVCFFLLSTLPNITRKQVISNALSLLSPKGKAIFVDWHTPFKFHPLGYFVKLYNRLHHPFTEHFLKNEISDAVNKSFAKKFSWNKECYFGGMFQKTIAKRKDDSLSLLDNF